MQVRIRLLGRMYLLAGQVVVPATAFPGRQGRLAFAYLAAHHRPVPRDELAEALWDVAPPDRWPAHVAAIVSKLRGLLNRVGCGECVIAEMGTYELRLPANVEVDLDAAPAYLEDAEGALRAGGSVRALAAADTAAGLARRAFLPGEQGLWLDQARAGLRLTLIHALEVEVDLLRLRGDLHDALRLAEEAVSLEPFRESAHVRLMRVHLTAGNRAEGLRAYERCRQLLASELGVGPCAEALATYQQLLHAGP